MKTILLSIGCLWALGLCAFLPTSTTDQVVHHSYYSLSYSEFHEQAEWVAYELNPDMLSGRTQRTNNFREDPLIETGSASKDDYRGSGYDRGHLAPAGDMKVNRSAMSESFYMSNMSPQKHSFNAGIWLKMERYVRDWVEYRNCNCIIVTGPVLSMDLEVIHGTSVSIPDYYYKIVVDLDQNDPSSQAFLVPAVESFNDIFDYQVTIFEIEEITGIDFFPDLSIDIQSYLEDFIHY